MITTLLVICGTSLVLIIVLLAIVVAGIKQEPPSSELSIEAPRFIASRVRRLLGVYVRRPETEPGANETAHMACSSGSPTRGGDDKW